MAKENDPNKKKSIKLILISIVWILFLLSFYLLKIIIGGNGGKEVSQSTIPIYASVSIQKESFSVNLDSENGRVTIEGFGKGLLRLGNVVGYSMSPTLEEGSYVIISYKLIKEIKAGDILVYNAPLEGRIIVHRVVEVGVDDLGWYVETQGDNRDISPKPDVLMVREDDVLGIVVVYIPKIK